MSLNRFIKNSFDMIITASTPMMRQLIEIIFVRIQFILILDNLNTSFKSNGTNISAPWYLSRPSTRSVYNCWLKRIISVVDSKACYTKIHQRWTLWSTDPGMYKNDSMFFIHILGIYKDNLGVLWYGDEVWLLLENVHVHAELGNKCWKPQGK